MSSGDYTYLYCICQINLYYGRMGKQAKKSVKTARAGKRVFLDYASATPLDPKVFKIMKPYFEAGFHNPSSLYKEGVATRTAVESARERVARAIGSRKDEIIFTSGGTESINIALLGLYAAAWKKDPAQAPHVITSSIEHPAVLETCRHLEQWGGEVTYISPREDGRIHADDVAKALKPHTAFVSLMHVNNEIGTINPLREISRIIRAWKDAHDRDITDAPYFHTDASQSPNYLDIRKETLGVDLMTLDGSKIYGPKGAGILFKKHFIQIEPSAFGGSQEKGLRPGTENVPLIVGFAEALDIAVAMREKESVRVAKIRDYCLKLLQEKFDGKNLPVLRLNGSLEHRVPNNLNFCIEGLYAEFAVIQLDAKGIAVSSVTACRNPDEETFSHVVAALPNNAKTVGKNDCARSSLRVTFGRKSTSADAKNFVERLFGIVNKKVI